VGGERGDGTEETDGELGVLEDGRGGGAGADAGGARNGGGEGGGGGGGRSEEADGCRESIVEGEDEVVVSGRRGRKQWGRCGEEEECRQLLYGEGE
jgi:hypothetical protein